MTMYKISLKQTFLNDYDAYYKIRCSPGDIYWNGYLSKPDYDKLKKIFIQRISNTPFNIGDRHIYLIILHDGTNSISIGFIQLLHRESCIEIGYTVIEDYQGKGFATEALKLALTIARKKEKKVIVCIRDDNIASQKVAIKCGFFRTDEYIEKEYPKVGIVKLRTYYNIL